MRDVSDAFLLNMSEVSAALIGLFLVGIFFFADTGFRRLDQARGIVEPYFRASTRIVLVLYALPLGLSLSLVALEPVWSRVLFALLSLMLLAANVDTAARIRAVSKVTGSTALLVNELAGTAGGPGDRRPPVDSRRTPSDQGGPDLGDPALLCRRVRQHRRDGAVRPRLGGV